MSKIIYKSVKVELHSTNTKNSLTVAEAKELLGWEVTESKDFLFRDIEGAKINLRNNPTNRPFRMVLAKRYASEMLRGKWKLNGETIVFDRHGECLSGQHRLVGFVIAEQQRKQGKLRHNWKKAVTIECLLVLGVHESAADTLDLGQKRSLGDVIYRRAEFTEVSKKDQKRMANVLGHTIRLVWLRSNGKNISDAPHFPHSEALDFLEQHPRLLEAVKFIHDSEGGRGAEGSRITKRISPGYAAGLMYLTAMSTTDPKAYIEDGSEALEDKLWEEAEEFWTLFASGANLDEGNPILVLRELLLNMDAQSGAGRDDIVGASIKAINAWLDDKKGKVKGANIKLKKKKDKETGKLLLNEDEPRLGGMDFHIDDVELPAEPEAEESSYVEDTKQKGNKSKGGWKVGDTAWVQDLEDGHWFGTVTSITDDKKIVYLTADADGKEWEASMVSLYTGYPPKQPKGTK